MRYPLVLIAAALATSAASAQFLRTAPARYHDGWAYSSGTGTVFGGTKGRMQALYIAPVPANTPLFDFGFRRAPGTSDYAGYQLELQVTVDSTNLSLAQLDKTFANNVGANATVVFPRAKFDIPTRGANSAPSDFVWFKPSQPYIFLGPNLIVDLERFDTTWTSKSFRNDRTFATSNGNAVTWGMGCGSAKIDSSSAGNYLPGSSIDFTLASAPANAPAIGLIGFSAVTWGPIALPLPLDALGMNGCLLMVSPDIVVPTQADANGAARLTLPIPNQSSLAQFGLVAQWLYVDAAANPAGLVTTAGENVRVGPIVPQNRYVYDLFDNAAATGTLQDGGPILGLESAR